LHSPAYLQTRDNMKKEVESIYWRVGMRWWERNKIDSKINEQIREIRQTKQDK
jgi:hypothetical protein